MLILALLSQLLAASLTSLVVIRALRGLTDRLNESLPPSGATLVRRWMTAALVAIGVTSGLQLGAGSGAALGAWPFLGEGTARWDVSLFILAGVQAGGAVLGALRGLAFATLFLLGLGILGGAFGPAQDRPTTLVRGGEPARRLGSRREPGRRELPRGPRPMRGDDPRSPGEPRRMPGGGGGGRGRGPAPDRERGRESFREGPSLATQGAGSGVATRYGARPLPDTMPGHAPGAAARGPLRGPGDRFPRNGPPRGRDPVSAGRSAGIGERRGLSPNEPPPGARERMGAGDRPLDNEPGG